MTTELRAELAVDARDMIGEGPTWDARESRLLWSDNATGIVHEAKVASAGGLQETRRWNLLPCADAPIPRYGAVIPRTRGGLVVASGTDVFMLDEAGNVTPFVHLDANPNLVRFNDAKCDSQGRLWVGTLATDWKSGGAALYRIDPDGTVNTMLTGVTASNGLDWSPDESTFYYIDSLARTIEAFDFDKSWGWIKNRRTVATVRFGDGLPDGMTVDREGCLWVAIAGAGHVRRYAPDGTCLVRVVISAPVSTSCTFGGADAGDLFITSAALRLPQRFATQGISPEVVENSHSAPGAGGLFVCRPGPKGKPANSFAG